MGITAREQPWAEGMNLQKQKMSWGLQRGRRNPKYIKV